MFLQKNLVFQYPGAHRAPVQGAGGEDRGRGSASPTSSSRPAVGAHHPRLRDRPLAGRAGALCRAGGRQVQPAPRLQDRAGRQGRGHRGRHHHRRLVPRGRRADRGGRRRGASAAPASSTARGGRRRIPRAPLVALASPRRARPIPADELAARSSPPMPGSEEPRQPRGLHADERSEPASVSA